MTYAPIVVALDFSTEQEALDFASTLEPASCRLKVGKELFTRVGPSVVSKLQAQGFEVFLDLKYHDIPQTVALACQAAADLGVWMVNVHAMGGERMMQAAYEAIQQSAHKPLLIAVTLLTSHSEEDVENIGLSVPIADTVVRLAKQARSAGLDGVVCSAQEASAVKEACGQDFLCVCPGIRLAEQSIAGDDQQRILTPQKAQASGADYLVMGRSIRCADNPKALLTQIGQDLA